MTAPTYPVSSDVVAGQPTQVAHYNNLRAEALYLNAGAANSLPLGSFLNKYARGIKLQYLATARLRIPYVTSDPPTIYVNGYMLQATANVDLAAGLFSGGAATWYVFAVRTAASTTFTLTVNTSAVESVDMRIIGEVEWSGTAITNVKDYFTSALGAADYDSGWFACAYNNTYTKAHGLNQYPRLVQVYHSATGGTDEWVLVSLVVTSTTYYSPVGYDATNVYVQCGTSSTYGCVFSTRRSSGGGYYRILAWK